jgi:hypothetical protein
VTADRLGSFGIEAIASRADIPISSDTHRKSRFEIVQAGGLHCCGGEGYKRATDGLQDSRMAGAAFMPALRERA